MEKDIFNFFSKGRNWSFYWWPKFHSHYNDEMKKKFLLVCGIFMKMYTSKI